MSTFINDFSNSVVVGVSVYPAEVDSTDTGSSVDMVHADGQCFAIQFVGGVGGSDPTLDGKVQESADGSTWVDISGATFTQVTASNNVQSIVFRRNLRYLRHARTISGTSPTFVLGAVFGEVKKML